jgi:hypothetical protein
MFIVSVGAERSADGAPDRLRQRGLRSALYGAVLPAWTI